MVYGVDHDYRDDWAESATSGTWEVNTRTWHRAEDVKDNDPTDILYTTWFNEWCPTNSVPFHEYDSSMYYINFNVGNIYNNDKPEMYLYIGVIDDENTWRTWTVQWVFEDWSGQQFRVKVRVWNDDGYLEWSSGWEYLLRFHDYRTKFKAYYRQKTSADKLWQEYWIWTEEGYSHRDNEIDDVECTDETVLLRKFEIDMNDARSASEFIFVECKHTGIEKLHRMADIDGDGDVDGTDFNTFIGHYPSDPASNTHCDFDWDGDIDGTDWNIFVGYYPS